MTNGLCPLQGGPTAGENKKQERALGLRTAGWGPPGVRPSSKDPLYSWPFTHLQTVHGRDHHDKVIGEESAAAVELALPPAVVFGFLQTHSKVALRRKKNKNPAQSLRPWRFTVQVICDGLLRQKTSAGLGPRLVTRRQIRPYGTSIGKKRQQGKGTFLRMTTTSPIFKSSSSSALAL